jgi:hypothetical protein
MTRDTLILASFALGGGLFIFGVTMNRRAGGRWLDSPLAYPIIAKCFYCAGLAVLLLTFVVARRFL